jgi:hypothetical protein
MATNAELDMRVKAVEKSLEEAIGAIRSIGQQSNLEATSIARLADENNRLKGEVAQLKTAVKVLENKLIAQGGGTVNRYE